MTNWYRARILLDVDIIADDEKDAREKLKKQFNQAKLEYTPGYCIDEVSVGNIRYNPNDGSEEF